MSLNLEQIEQVAPDQASLNAARKLLNQPKWPELHRDKGHTLLWGACQGSGSTPYRVAVDLSDLGAKCSCPSRKFPCKHAIALMWWQADRADLFTESGDVPEWIADWLGRRRKSTGTGGKAKKKGPKKSAAAAATVQERAPADPERARRQRERTRKAREKSIANGLDELDLWLSDQVDRGFSTFAGNAVEQCRLMSQRLVDAKAGGLATWVEMLPARYFAAPEARRQTLLTRFFGSLHLLAEAYRRQARLPPDLRADVRRLVGWPEQRAELLDDTSARRVNATWTVLATARELQPDRLIRFETWIRCDDRDAAPDTALLVDYVPAAAASKSAPSLEPGTRVQAELVFYRSQTPLRALIATQGASSRVDAAPRPEHTLHDALADYDRQLGNNPWLPDWPIGCKEVAICGADDGALWAVDAARDVGVPLAGDAAAVLRGLEHIDLYGAYDGYELTPLAANTPLGAWWSMSA